LGRFTRARWVAVALTGLVLIAGLGASVAWARTIDEQQSSAAAQVLDRRVATAQTLVSGEARRYVDAVQDIAAGLGAQADLRLSDFMDITAPLSAQRLGGASSVTFLVPATNAEIATAQAYWRAHGATGVTLQPAGDATHIFSIFRRQLDGAATVVVGVDATQAVEPTQAVILAQRTSDVVVSHPYQLITDRTLPVNERQLSFVLAAPVYSPPDVDGLRAFRGWVVMAMRASDFVKDTLAKSTQGQMDIALQATTAGGAMVPVAALDDGRPEDLHRVVKVGVAQQQWTLVIEASAAVVYGSWDEMLRVALLSGFSITVLLAVLVFVMLTARARALSKVDLATAELLAQQRELKAFAGVVAHDLKGPLTGMAGFAEILRDDLVGNSSPHVTHGLDRISQGVERMRSLIDDLLAYATARDQSVQPQTVELQSVVADVISERTAHLRVAAGADGRPRPFPDVYIGPLPAVDADPAMVRQLLDNLIGNALKYTVPGQPARLDIAADEQPDGWVRVEVADRGIGIPADQHDRVFTTFHRAHATGSYDGTGLGLAICHRIVERHGGRIGVVDNPGGGSRFWFTLPLAYRQAPAPGERRPTPSTV
jgi:signal transduction histidine kinase